MDPHLLVGDEDASFISMFLANPNPMMASLCKSMQKAIGKDENCLEQVVNMANACCFLAVFLYGARSSEKIHQTTICVHERRLRA
jgi:hypothetical protein